MSCPSTTPRHYIYMGGGGGGVISDEDTFVETSYWIFVCLFVLCVFVVVVVSFFLYPLTCLL